MSWFFKKFNKIDKLCYNEHIKGEKMERRSEVKEGTDS